MEQPVSTDPVAPAPPPPPAERRRIRWGAPIGIGLSILAILVGLIVLAWAILFVTKGRFLKARFESIASSLSERQVKVAGEFQLYFDPINVKFVADGLSVSNPSWASKPNFLTADHIDTRISTIRLIFGARHARWLNLNNGAIDTEWDKTHTHNTWTFGDPNKKGEPLQMPVIERAAVTGTTLRYRDPVMGIATDQRFGDVDATGRHIDNAISFAGAGTYKGHGFTNSGALLSPNTTVTMGRTQLRLHADFAHTHLDAAALLPALTSIEGAKADVSVRGSNVRLLFDPFKIVVPDTRAYHLRSHVEKVAGEYRFTRLAGVFGDSDIAGSMTISLPNDRPTLKADLASDKVDIIDIGPMVGYDPNKLATVGATAAASTQSKTDHPRILPDAPLRAEALKTFDAHVNYKVRVIRAPHVPVSNVALTLDLDHNLLKLSPVTMDVSGGKLDADIALNARDPRVITDYDIRLSPTPMGRLLAGWGVDESGTTGTIAARVKMHGIGDSVRKSLATSDGRIAIMIPAGDFWTRNVQLAEFDVGVFVQRLLQKKLKKPVHINCGLIAFTVKDGIAAADPILIDTDANVMAAKGGFSFKDESMNIQFRADAKKFSVFSGQSPVNIGGYFAQPKLGIITPQLVGRAGAAVALGVFGTPIASVLAFVDPGDAKSAACGPVLAAAPASAQHTTKGKPIKLLGTKGKNSEQAAQPKPEKKKVLGIF
ncbi:AsmA family protein [Sphingomonas sp. CGMCC 1.13654]|uniref:AsmA family protein n=1 Tax=Sphingomonas chungangi TaxID=2683589 RepID=A0A838L9M4_9SPHN|nr:AsmA family protein [Sphingomonas chungangi]MBA2935415.1 AsmA family protein [Sphingomonas chungangi]MVW56922.1 AsmA family protein [Sphingomonas chungangi]